MTDKKNTAGQKPLLSIILPAYNEAGILDKNTRTIYNYLKTLESEYRYEIIIVNDGSSDETPEIAGNLSNEFAEINVVDHVVNMGLGTALRTGFANSTGDYVVVLDIDLSYSTHHIQSMLDTIKATKVQVVVASPYMKGGKLTNVPWLRKFLSIWANRFLHFFNPHAHIHTVTGMVRAYDGAFIRALNLRSMDININTEIIYKTMLLRGRILEIPAHLDWSLQREESIKRVSSFKVAKGIIQYIISGFIFRPFMFYVLPGFTLGLLSLYPLIWMLIHIIESYSKSNLRFSSFDFRLSDAIATAFSNYPHTFIISGLLIMVSLQLLSLGLIAYQNKTYFEEIFHLGSNKYK